MTYYIKGGSKFNEANPKVWVNLFLGGYNESFYLDTNWKNIADKGVETDGDPYWRLGGLAGGLEMAEFGLRNKSRIKCGDEGGVESVWGWDIIGGAWVDLIAGGGVAHNRLHAMTGILDHSANQWKMWYSDGGILPPVAQVKEFALGVAGTLIKSAGPAAPPTFTTHTLDNAFDHGKVIDGATSSANAFKVGDGADKFYIYASGGNLYIEVQGGGHIVLKDGDLKATPGGGEKIYDAVWN